MSQLTGDNMHPCNSQKYICLEAKNEDNCEICLEGYSLYNDTDGNQKCQKCDNDIQTQVENVLTSIPTRCNFTFDAQLGKPIQQFILACNEGFVDPLTNQCTSNCGLGRYGEVSFNRRGFIETSKCSQCDDNCFECASQTECISCKKGFYLQADSTSKTTGLCIQKQGSREITIYVDSALGKFTLDQTTGLTLDDPIFSLQSAISH
ncbi:UNKNOWN [Stylonychia lemnae]|uniref:Uncharacterized protein n=1 Tax=Stylonychia lemnae TaxID=5949 RepID=A0A078B2L3_STYLE|nr:UNKNOWN [Stylonychia lemnae]|eukprot:CDW88780.1 UNKNOWN [Stylonychia lemnae]